MLITEIVEIDGNEFVYNHSDSGFLIERDGVVYSEAYDPIVFKDERIYTETNIKIEEVDSELDENIISEE